MAFSLIAENPEQRELSIFNRSAWIWHPLWEYVETKYPEIADAVKYGHSNDGDGLSGENSKKLGLLIKSDVESGVARKYVEEFNAFLDSLEDTTCPRCFGFGLNRIGILKAGSSQCIKCSGTGKARPPVCSYWMRESDLDSFAEFLINCGGFKIT
jgi:hypothetical protein